MANPKLKLNTPGTTGLNASEGESGGLGSAYSGVLVERKNKSVNRNWGPSREGFATGSVPVVDSGVRNTGRV